MPKLLAVPFGVKGVAIAASAFAHVAIAYASLSAGHATPASALVDPRADEVEIEAPVEPTPETPVVPSKADDDDEHPHVTPHPAHAHTHDYPVAPSHDTTPHDPRLVHAPLAPAAPKNDAPSDEAAPAITAPAASPVRIAITVGTGGGGGGATSSVGGAGSSVAPSAPPSAPEIVPESSVSIPARAIATVRPVYPPAARAAEIEADVTLEIVVDANGVVTSARTTRAAGYGLDDAALQAVRRFRFAPAQRNGHAIGVRMRWVMQFRFQ